MTTVLEEKVDQILEEGRQSLKLLETQHRHAAWHALKQSIWPRFEYWAQNCYPSHSLPAARRLDQGLLSLLELVCGFSIPQGQSQHGITLPTPIPGREQLSFAAWVVRQPVKCGGFGLRSYVELCRPAFIGAVELAVPRLYDGFCPLLVPMVGGEDRFGEDGDGRWQTLLDSGCRAGRELAASWLSMQQETRLAMEFLGEGEEEAQGPLSTPVESAGDGSVSESTR